MLKPVPLLYTSNGFYYCPRTTDAQWRHKSKISEKLGRCGRQNMLRPYLKIWDLELISGHAVIAISSPGVRSPCLPWLQARQLNYENPTQIQDSSDLPIIYVNSTNYYLIQLSDYICQRLKFWAISKQVSISDTIY